jgi:hypothetical protein
MRAKRVALNMTVPSLFSGIFIDTSLCTQHGQRGNVYATYIANKLQNTCYVSHAYLTGHPVWTQFAEAQRWIDLSQQCDNIQVFDTAPDNRTIRPANRQNLFVSSTQFSDRIKRTTHLASGSYSDQSRTNSSR